MRVVVLLGLLALVGCAAAQPQVTPVAVAPNPAPLPMTELQRRDAAMLTEIRGGADSLATVRRYAMRNVADGLAPPPSPNWRPRANLSRSENVAAAERSRLLSAWGRDTVTQSQERRAAYLGEARQRQHAADDSYCRSLGAEVGTIGMPPLESVTRQAIGMQQPYEGTAYQSCMLGFSRDRAWLGAQ